MKIVLLFLLKFAIAVPVCLLLWWGGIPSSYPGIMTAYAWGIGQAAGMVLMTIMGASIESLDVVADGILNSKSVLNFHLVNGHIIGLPIDPLVTNLPSYVALVLATGGLGWKKQTAIAVGGSLILMASHIAYILLVFPYTPSYAEFLIHWRQIPEILITFPFLLWIILAYSDRIRLYLSAGEEDPSETVNSN